jgi:hypothetical protein
VLWRVTILALTVLLLSACDEFSAGPVGTSPPPVAATLPETASTTVMPTPLLPAASAFPSSAPLTPAAPTPYIFPTPKPPEMLQQERAALLARVEQFLNQNGYSPTLQLPDLRQSPTDCQVRTDSILRPQSVGEVPIVLLSLEGGPNCEGLFILHWDGQVWHRQILAPYGGSGDPAAVAAVQQAGAGHLDLGIAWNLCVHCSVNFIWYALLRLVNDQWVTLWRPADSRVWHSAHGAFTFQNGLKRLSIQYSDWTPPEKKFRPDGNNIFGAANGGPHRYFVDTWQRNGDSYQLLQTVSLPSTYKTAVEFVYALMQNDDRAAALWTTNAVLVHQARELRLNSLAEPAWAEDDDKAGTVEILRNESPATSIPKMTPYVILHMTKLGEEWLIASIEQLP